MKEDAGKGEASDGPPPTVTEAPRLEKGTVVITVYSSRSRMYKEMLCVSWWTPVALATELAQMRFRELQSCGFLGLEVGDPPVLMDPSGILRTYKSALRSFNYEVFLTPKAKGAMTEERLYESYGNDTSSDWYLATQLSTEPPDYWDPPKIPAGSTARGHVQTPQSRTRELYGEFGQADTGGVALFNSWSELWKSETESSGGPVDYSARDFQEEDHYDDGLAEAPSGLAYQLRESMRPTHGDGDGLETTRKAFLLTRHETGSERAVHILVGKTGGDPPISFTLPVDRDIGHLVEEAVKHWGLPVSEDVQYYLKVSLLDTKWPYNVVRSFDLQDMYISKPASILVDPDTKVKCVAVMWRVKWSSRDRTLQSFHAPKHSPV